MHSKLEFDRIDLTDFVVIIALSIGLILAIQLNQKELSMSIVSGMFGYIGGSYTKQGKQNHNNGLSDSNLQITSTESVQTNRFETTTKDSGKKPI